MTCSSSLTAYVGAFVDELARNGLRDVVVCPGSRSAPLALLFEAHARIRVWMQIDERSAAFFALGMAKASLQAVGIVCSSGTAAANFYPAIIEAKLARVPLLVMTADRPHELRDMGAPQTIDQCRIYGNHVKWFVDMALPEKENSLLRWVRHTAARAVAVSQNGSAGPVHINFPFREPLVPDLASPSLFSFGSRNTGFDPSVQIKQGESFLSVPLMDDLVSQFLQVDCGIIICGSHGSKELVPLLAELASITHFPILADPLSPLRTGEGGDFFTQYDTFLRFPEVYSCLQPDFVLRIGGVPISKSLSQYLQIYSTCVHWVVDEGGGWRDPMSLANQMLYTDAVSFLRSLISILEKKGFYSQANWEQRWRMFDTITRKSVMKKMREMDELFEGRVFWELRTLLSEGEVLFVGNSMPIRDIDAFFFDCTRKVRVLCNRGANGIDGVISTALGVATQASVTLVIGDLSFYHDLNGLLASQWHALSITIVLINNCGGGIFSFLPQAQKAPSSFEKLFGTPLNVDFSLVVSMYKGRWISVHSWESFRCAYRQSKTEGGLWVIEVPSDRCQNVAFHEKIWEDVHEEIKNFLSELS